MEASGGRKKRAWRKPRELATPEREGASSVSAQKPVKLQRTSKHQATPYQPTDSTPEHKDLEIGHGKELIPPTNHEKMHPKEEVVPYPLEPEPNGRTASTRGVAVSVSCGQAAPLDIDGSVMEGVSKSLCFLAKQGNWREKKSRLFKKLCWSSLIPRGWGGGWYGRT